MKLNINSQIVEQNEKKLNKFERKMNMIFLTNNGKLFEWWWFCDRSGQLIWFNWNQIKTMKKNRTKSCYLYCVVCFSIQQSTLYTVPAVSYTYRIRFSVVSLLNCEMLNAKEMKKNKQHQTNTQHTNQRQSKREYVRESFVNDGLNGCLVAWLLIDDTSMCYVRVLFVCIT